MRAPVGATMLMILAGVPSTWQKAVIGSFILIAGAVFATRKKK